MHEIAHASIQQEEEGEEGDLEQEQSAALAAVALMIIGVEEPPRLCTEPRHPSQLSVCRPQLLPNSHKDTPWQVLYQSHSDCAFITAMGFDVDAFTYVVKCKTC